MPRNLLVLGGGVYHIPLVEQIKTLGHKCVATSYLKNDPALSFADVAAQVSSTDVEALERLVVDSEIAAILTTASDWNTFSQAALNEKFAFRGVLPEQVNAVSEKFGFNQLLKKLELPHVLTEEVILTEPFFSTFKNRSKYIFKPVKGSGSADVFTTENNFPSVLTGRTFLVQRYINGAELGGQAMIERGSVAFLALSKKILVNGVVPFAHIVGTEETAPYCAEIQHQLKKIVAEIKLEYGTLNFDVRVENERVFIIDLSLRLSGNGLIEAINESFGVNLFANHIQQIVDGPRELSPHEKPVLAASVVLGTAKAETDLVAIRTKIESLIEDSDIESIALVWDEITQSEAFVKSKNRIGHIIFTAQNQGEIESFIHETKQILGFNQ